MSDDKQLSVRLQGVPMGVLSQLETGRMTFRYLPETSRPLSLSLPVSDADFGDPECEAYFGGLLPESDSARRAIAGRFGISPRSTFALLRAIGLDCAGAVSFHPLDAPAERVDPQPLDAVEIPDARLATYLRELPRKPLLIGTNGIRLSLAGAQEKAAVCVIAGKIALPRAGSPTTHIVKPTLDDHDDLFLNEYLCLVLAERVGLQVPRVETRVAGDVPYVLIERYDRDLSPAGEVMRIHQEDFCQALGVPYTMKYQAEGGPGFKECFALTDRMTVPATGRIRLLRHALFNLLIGNCDAHAKNYSLLHFDSGAIGLAPAYDVVCTRYYPDLTDHLAMKVAGHYHARKLEPGHLDRFAGEIGMAPGLVRRTVRDLAARIAAEAPALAAAKGEPKALAILEFIAAHSARLARKLLAQAPSSVTDF